MTLPGSWLAIELRRNGPPPGSADAGALLRSLIEIVTTLDPAAIGWFVRGRTPAAFAIGEPDAFARALLLAAPNARDLARGKPSTIAGRAGDDAEVELSWPAGAATDEWRFACRFPRPPDVDPARALDQALHALSTVFAPEQVRSSVLAAGERGIDAAVPFFFATETSAPPGVTGNVQVVTEQVVPSTATAPARPPDTTLDVQFPLPDTTLPFGPPPGRDETAFIGSGARLAPSEEGFRAALTETPIPDMPLEQYAAFHVELRLKGAIDASMALRYGVPSAAVHRALVESFRRRFAADTALAERFAELLRKMSGAYGGGKAGG